MGPGTPSADFPKSEEDPSGGINLHSVHVTVDRVVVNIKGGKTKNDILEKSLKNILAAKNFAEMVRKTHDGKILLEKLELFKKIEIEIDTSKGKGASSDGYEIKYNVEERKYPMLNVRTEIGDHSANDANFVLRLKYPNVFGRGEVLSAHGNRNLNENTGFGIQFQKPINGDPDIKLGVSGYKSHLEYPWSSFKETSIGTAIDLVFPTKLGSHCLKWEGVWRDMRALGGTTSFNVREQAGHTLKSSIQHVLTRDKRDDRILPNEGYLINLMQEYAGVGGNVEFIKNDVELQYNLPLFWDSVLQVSLAAGVLSKIDQSKDIRINDKFFLGGPLTLRGFKLNGVGPHADGNALGADAYWLGGIHLYTPLPFRPGKGGFGELFRSHFFLTAGNLGNIDTNQTAIENFKNLTDTLRLSYGLGVVLRLGGIARLEVNYVFPVRYQTGDRIDQGFGFGVGVSFL